MVWVWVSRGRERGEWGEKQRLVYRSRGGATLLVAGARRERGEGVKLCITRNHLGRRPSDPSKKKNHMLGSEATKPRMGLRVPYNT